MRQTSINCYLQIKREGLLSKRRLQVLEAMLIKAPCTAGELEKYMNDKFNVRGGWKQLSILRKQGVIEELGTTICPISNRNVIKWGMTGNLPVKSKKSKKPSNFNKSVNYILKGMEIRNWDTISKEMLIKLKDDGIKTKKTT